MASPPYTRHVPARSVARSLVDAAAALRAQEWRGAGISSASRVSTHVAESCVPRQMPRYEEENATSYSARYTGQEKQSGVIYDREALYEELRERHRNLTERQRKAREFFAQKLQPHQRRYQGGEDTTTSEIPASYSAPKRQRVAADTRQQRQPLTETEATHLRSTYPPPPSMLPNRRLRDSEEIDTDRALTIEQQTVSPVPAPFVQVSDSRIPRSNLPPVRTGTPQSGPQEDHNAPTAPSVIEDAENDVDDEAAVMGGDAQKKQKKRVRYLRDTDRRNIIKRIENGEKQAALAREFGVTRAAICHIKKNRFEILSRYNTLVKSAQKCVEMMVHQVRAKSVLLLMTMLRDTRSSGATFRRVAGRLIMHRECGGDNWHWSSVPGSGTQTPVLWCRYRHRGFPFLVLFHQMEPEAPQGSIHVEAGTDRRGHRVWRLDHMDLPANIAQHKVLLFSSTCSTGNAECKAIEALCSVGCDERSISLVVILVASDGVVNISNRFPRLTIITGGIDGTVDLQTDSIVPGFGDFVARYNGS
ncbi:Phosphoribosyltransferase-like [Phytophthora cactorum]|nr:Phosphoribosyltransferase-like [Phytophthora cactorum]